VTDLRSRLVAALGSTYQLERELGGGGMSRVFLADETSLGRKVVIKVLPPEMAAGVNQDRFRREIQLAAKLQHPHIVPLLAAGSSDDLLWYAMPFIEGESLRVKLAREGELPVVEALRILREVADALAYAHARGVVHRDIKPDNVMISGRHALVTDFGVAKAVTESTGGQSLTSLGVALGTPAYMAPEQASADPHVDHRADLYALGAMAYEMLCGQPPFTGPSPQAVLAAHVTKAVEPMTGIRPAVPAALNAVVMRCLEKRASDRWQTADELIPQLEALLTPSGGTAPTSATAAVSSGTEAALKRTHPFRVAALFGAATLVLLTAVYWLVHQLGLPDWVLPAAVVLLLAGLPVVLMASRQERKRAMARATGMITVSAPHGPIGRLMTLRGALSGGVLAFAGLAAGTGAFMGLRAMGVGPFATLVTAGIISGGDRLVLADFENRTTDETLGESVTSALRIDLTRSAVVRLLEGEDVAAGLRRMQRDPVAPLTPDLARELAEREGARAVILGEIAPLGAGFVLSARLVGTDGTTLLAERETAADATQLIGAVDKLSRKLRAGIGESLRTLRGSQRLEEVTTSSLEALRQYSQAERLADQSRWEDARALLEQALASDSTFAMAWRKLAVVLGNSRLDFARQVHAAERAFALRDRLPERERLITTAYYYRAVENDVDREIQAYEQLLARWPDDIASLNNVAIAYGEKRRWADAERVTTRGVAISPATGVLWANLMESQASQGRFAAAESTLRRWAEAAPEVRNRYVFGFRLAWAKEDYAAAAAYADSVGQQDLPNLQSLSRFQRSGLAVLSGRLAEADRLREEGTAMDVRRGAVSSVYFTSGAEVDVLLRGRPDRARRTLDSLLARYPLEALAPANRPYLVLARQFALAGDVARAERLVREYEREIPEVLRRNDPDVPMVQGTLALASGRPGEAIRSFRAARELQGCQICWLFEIGQAFDAMGQPDSALAAFEELVSVPTPGPSGRPITLPQAHYRLGELYEGKGDRARAMEAYGKFVEFWAGADAELQPRVAAVRQRIAALTAQEGR
jgi:tetratricopeptide (TPR) repeat protein